MIGMTLRGAPVLVIIGDIQTKPQVLPAIALKIEPLKTAKLPMADAIIVALALEDAHDCTDCNCKPVAHDHKGKIIMLNIALILGAILVILEAGDMNMATTFATMTPGKGKKHACPLLSPAWDWNATYPPCAKSPLVLDQPLVSESKPTEPAPQAKLSVPAPKKIQ